jgi:hypothetical protein
MRSTKAGWHPQPAFSLEEYMSRSKNPESISALVLSMVGLSLFTLLLWRHIIGEGVYAGLLALLAAAGLALFGFRRLVEINFKELKITLDRIEQVKSEVTELYTNINHLKRLPFVLDASKMRDLGLAAGKLATADATMRYTAGCIKRERERLARIFAQQRDPELLSRALIDPSLDELVFKWNGPETPLDASPEPLGNQSATST